MEISDNPGIHEPGEPEFKYVSTMHGNEVTGRQNLLYLMQYLCDGYSTNSKVKSLVDSTRIHFLPCMNPDGFDMARRSLVKQRSFVVVSSGLRIPSNVDLNRNFPDRFRRSTGNIQPETQAIMDWLEQYPFVLSANLHNGALVANYPFDNSISGKNVYSPTTNDDIFVELALSYSLAHPTMYFGRACGDTFPNGVTNGAEWYNVDGGMQDYNYLHSNCLEITLELGCNKFPAASELQHLWEDNLPPMLAFMEQVHRGVKGFVRDLAGNAIEGAVVSVTGRMHDVVTAVDGDYWWLLLPGEYALTASADGHTSSSARVTVADSGVTVANFTLESCTNQCVRGGKTKLCPSKVLSAVTWALLV